MLNNKKAQIGETVTWVVATLIIVVVLGISVLATFSVSNEKTIFLDDKEKDFIATKSITNFLRNPDNIELLENEDDYAGFEKKIRVLMETSPNITVDGFELHDKTETKIEILTYRLRTSPITTKFETNIFFEEIELKFSSVCRENCR